MMAEAPAAAPPWGGEAPLLAVEGLDAGYGDVQVLWGISLGVARGEAVALVGSNGAGKTTLLRTISGMLPARGGRVLFAGRDITSLPPDRRVALGLAHVPEGRQVFAGMSVRENLLMGAYTRQGGRAAVQADLDQVYSLFPVLADRKEQLAGTMSGGEQQMLAIGRGLMSRPKMLLLDEPSLGLAPILVTAIFKMIQTIHQKGMTILLVEQNARMALKIASRAYVLEIGQIVLEGDSDTVRRSPVVQEAYLGGS